MIHKVIVWLTFVVLGVFLATVASAETIRGEGRYFSNKLTHLTPFTSIDVRGDAQVDLWQQNTPNITVSGKSNLVELSNIYVEDETLVIDFKRPVHIKGNHALHVAVRVPRVESIAVRGKGRVRVHGPFETAQLTLSASDSAYLTGDWLKTDSLRVQATNKAEVDLNHLQSTRLETSLFDKAEVELSGFAQEAKLVNHGSKELDAADLRTEQAHAQVNGTGDVTVFTLQTLKAEALGRGDIIYHGHPVLMRSGNVKQIRPAFKD